MAQWTRNVWTNVVANLVAAAIIFLGGVAFGLFPRSPGAIGAAVLIVLFTPALVAHGWAFYLHEQGRAGFVVRATLILAIPTPLAVLGVPALVTSSAVEVRGAGAGVIVAAVVLALYLARQVWRFARGRARARRRPGSLKPPAGTWDKRPERRRGIGRASSATPRPRRRVAGRRRHQNDEVVDHEQRRPPHQCRPGRRHQPEQHRSHDHGRAPRPRR